MTKKALDLADHKQRLVGSGSQGYPGVALLAALLALGLGFLLLHLLK